MGRGSPRTVSRRGFCASNAKSSSEEEQQKLKETARRVLESVRRQPRWESNLLSHHPSSHLFHPSCVRAVLQRLSTTNPLLSLRYFLFLSSSSPSPPNPDPTLLSSLLRSLSLARAWSPALLALRSSKPFGPPSPAALDSFLLSAAAAPHHHVFSDVISLFRFSPSLPTWNAALSSSLLRDPSSTALFWRFYQLMTSSTAGDGDESTAGYLIQALCRDGRPVDAYRILRDVSGKGLVPDAASVTKLISEFSRIGNFGKVSELLHLMIAAGRAPDIVTYQSVMHGMFKHDMGDEAFRIFNELKLRGYSPDTVTYTTVIDGMFKMGRMEEARNLWAEMRGKGIVPNQYTYNAVIDGYCKHGELERAKMVYDEMLARGCGESTVTINTMIAGLCLNGKVNDAVDLFKEMPKKGIDRDVITYNTLIQGLCNEGRRAEAMELYDGLLVAGMQPSVSTYTPLIVSLCKDGNVAEAVEMMRTMEARGFEPLVCSNDCIIDGFVKAGKAEQGLAWLVNMLEKNLRPREYTFNILVEFLTSEGRVDDALLVLNAMLEIGFSPGSSVCYLLVDKLCSGENRFLTGEILDHVLLERNNGSLSSCLQWLTFPMLVNLSPIMNHQSPMKNFKCVKYATVRRYNAC